MWFLLQGLVVFSVISSNIHWQWTPNGYLAAAIAIGAAYVATVVATKLLAREKRRAQSGQRHV